MSAPLDHVAQICAEPGGKPLITCHYFPECRCDAECVDRIDARMVRRLLIGFITATLAIATGLILWGMHS